ncbi:MAG: tetratricopeptide repeat protein [Parafilimonas sp.]
MKNLFFLLIATQLSLAANAQRNELDSLLNVLKNYHKNDTVKINLLNDIAYSYYTTDPDKGLAMAKEAATLSKKLNYPLKLATSYSRQGVNYAAKGDDSSALNKYQLAINIYTNAGYNKGAAAVYHNMGIVYADMSDYTLAITYHEKAYAILKVLGNKKGMANTINSIGVNYMYLSNYPKALDYYFKSLKICEEIHDEISTAAALSNISIIYTRLSNNTKALQYIQRALNLYKKQGSQQGIADSYGSMGSIYDNLNQTENSLTAYQQQLAISSAMNYERGMANASINIGIDYSEMKDYKNALLYLNKSIKSFQTSGNNSSLSAALDEVGKIYSYAPPEILFSEKITLSESYKKAIAFQLKSIEAAKEAQDLSVQKTALEDLSNTYEKQKDFEKALSAYKQSVILQDSILNEDKKLELNRIEMQYTFDKREDSIKNESEKRQTLSSAKIKQQQTIRNAVIAGTIIILLSAVLVFIFYKRKHDAVEKAKEAELNAEVADTEMKALRAQMNPHFIFNSLNSIGDYIIRNDIKAANNYLTKFAGVIRLILENSEHKTVTLEKDLKALELYMDIERLRLNNKFSYEIKVDETIDKNNVLVPPLILQPFVENSIWHGLTKKDGEGKIKIHISQTEDMLTCIIEDNGVGTERSEIFKQEVKAMSKKSLGMKITNARIAVINKVKNTNAVVEISNEEAGVRAKITLPVELNF